MRSHKAAFSIEKDDLEAGDNESDSLITERTSSPIPPLPPPAAAPPPAGTAAEFAFAFTGLLVSYLTWGVMQELIMDTKFSPTPLTPSGLFPSCKIPYDFCVALNDDVVLPSLIYYYYLLLHSYFLCVFQSRFGNCSRICCMFHKAWICSQYCIMVILHSCCIVKYNI